MKLLKGTINILRRKKMMSEILLILLTISVYYILYLKTKLSVALYSLDRWREMIVYFNGKHRLLKK